MPRIETVADVLRETAAQAPERAAVISRRGSLTFAELDRQADSLAQALLGTGLEPGDRVVLLVTPGPEMLVTAFAMARSGLIPVLVDPGMGRSNLRRCIEESGPKGMVGVPQAVWALRLLRWASDSLRVWITVGNLGPPNSRSWRTLVVGGKTERRSLPLVTGADPAAVAFTSGSTGPPKGVVYTHGMFLCQARILQRTFGVQSGEVDLATFPLFALFDPVWGATSVFPRMDFTRPGKADPVEIAGAIRRHNVTHMFASPALLGRLGAWAVERGVRFPTLRRVLCAGAPVSDLVLEQSRSVLQGEADVHTPYGATEALPVTTISAGERLHLGSRPGFGVCIGRPVEGVEVEVIRITDECLPTWDGSLRVKAGDVGELVVWGENVSSSYYRRPEADRSAKTLRGGRIGHRMGDLVRTDEAGRLWFCGRKSHRVTTAETTLFPVAWELMFNAHEAVKRSALVGIGLPGNQEPVLCVEPKRRLSRRERETLTRELSALAAAEVATRSIQRIVFLRDFPVDPRHNAKILRERLAERVQEEER